MWKRCAGLALFILLLAGQANAYDTGDVVIVTGDSTIAGTAVLRVVVLPGRLDVNAYTATSGSLGAVSGNVHYIAVLKP